MKLKLKKLVRQLPEDNRTKVSINRSTQLPSKDGFLTAKQMRKRQILKNAEELDKFYEAIVKTNGV